MSKRVIKVMADYTAFPVWAGVQGRCSVQTSCHCRRNYAAILAPWARDHDETLMAHGYAWPSDDVLRRWMSEGGARRYVFGRARRGRSFLYFDEELAKVVELELWRSDAAPT